MCRFFLFFLKGNDEKELENWKEFAKNNPKLDLKDKSQYNYYLHVKSIE